MTEEIPYTKSLREWIGFMVKPHDLRMCSNGEEYIQKYTARYYVSLKLEIEQLTKTIK